MENYVKNSYIQAAHQRADLGDLEGAIDKIAELLEYYKDDPEIYAYHGYYLYSFGNYADALKSFNNSIILKPNVPNTIFLRARCNEELDRISEARDDYVKVIHYDPTVQDAYINLGMIYEYLEENENAKSIYSEALALFGNDPLLESRFKGLQ
jgi:tetratricopeptide (TPR) repeat protein